MIVIYIQKNWLDTIGDVKNMILVRSEDENYISVLAMEKKLTAGYPFVEANLIRKMDDDEPFLPAKIPFSLISGIFDLTKKETESRFGFVTAKKKSKRT
ncbi:MAG: hypothetical protein DMG48_14085 [Acidobacteria bacterium]|nr:MAG: hypothetical protein DMG48_14085 [Acidobacteriota bacterium]PYU55506.1 MAG: hypothetical protein DMG55_27645 [Acidobacteriota bacterium]